MSKRNHLKKNRIVVLLLILALVAEAFSFSTFAKEASKKNGCYLLNDDGSEVYITDEEYKNLKEFGSFQADKTEGDYAPEKAQLPGISLYGEPFETHWDHLDFMPSNLLDYRTVYGVRVGLSSDGGNSLDKTSGWMYTIGYALPPVFSISGLKPNTTYAALVQFGNGSFGDLYTFKTGLNSKPPIKSVTVKAVNVKRRKVKHYLYGVYMYTEKFYTCKVKLIIKMKKRPGTPGIWIRCKVKNWDSGNVWLGGNKKSYSKLFAPYPNYFFKNPRHRVWASVEVCTGTDPVYGGKSIPYSKRKKLS